MTILILATLGVIGIIAGVIASRAGTRRSDEPSGKRFAKLFRVCRWVGLGLALASWPLTGLMAYPYDDGPGRPGPSWSRTSIGMAPTSWVL